MDVQATAFDTREAQRLSLPYALAPIQCSCQWMVTDLSQELRQPKHEADNVHLSSVEVKNMWSHYTFLGSSSQNIPHTVQTLSSNSPASMSEQQSGNSKEIAL
jgi:hypothetical protein